MKRQTTAPERAQRGAALVIGLIFLVVLSLLGVTAAQMSTLDERMAGAMRDRAIALQAAEMALRDAERDVLGQGTSPRTISGLTGFSADCGASGAASEKGLCYNGPQGYTSTPIWKTTSLTAAPSVVYGTFSGASTIPLVSSQPRYIIEGFRRRSMGGRSERFYYRITTRAVGANPNAVVWLQEVFTP